MQLPFDKPILTSGFGNRTINGHIEFHPGIDIIPAGSGGINGVPQRLKTPLVSCFYGVVTFSGLLAGGGYTVIIDGYVNDTPVRIAYSHLQPNLQVQVGDEVEECQIIGYMGYSGVNYANTHLHFGLSVNPQLDPPNVYHDNQQNPVGFLFGSTWNAREGGNEIILLG